MFYSSQVNSQKIIRPLIRRNHCQPEVFSTTFSNNTCTSVFLYSRYLWTSLRNLQCKCTFVVCEGTRDELLQEAVQNFCQAHVICEYLKQWWVALCESRLGYNNALQLCLKEEENRLFLILRLFYGIFETNEGESAYILHVAFCEAVFWKQEYEFLNKEKCFFFVIFERWRVIWQQMWEEAGYMKMMTVPG